MIPDGDPDEDDGEMDEEEEMLKAKTKPLDLDYVDERSHTVQRLSRDLSMAALTLSHDEARFLVDAYYIIQEDRMRSNAQVRALDQNKEPHMLLSWFAEQNRVLETQIRNALNRYSINQIDGEWLHSVYGVGPVIAAGMIAYIDIERAPTVGHIWAYAGYDPTYVWLKGQKRRYNADFKVLCYKTGESFVKFKNKPDCIYGHIYDKRKEQEARFNMSKRFKDQAAMALEKKNYRKETEAYKHYIVGMLPPAHIHARARRYAVKLFLSHLHHVMYCNYYREEPPFPYPFSIMGHDIRNYIPPPNFRYKR